MASAAPIVALAHFRNLWSQGLLLAGPQAFARVRSFAGYFMFSIQSRLLEARLEQVFREALLLATSNESRYWLDWIKEK